MTIESHRGVTNFLLNFAQQVPIPIPVCSHGRGHGGHGGYGAQARMGWRR